MSHEIAEVTFLDVVAAERGHVFIDRFDEGVRFIVLRGGASLCAYVGIPLDHPLAGHNYDDVPIDCHGGLTFGADGKDGFLPAGLFWYGWDYAHLGDRATYDVERPPLRERDEKEWTPAMVDQDAWSAINSIKTLMKLTEAARRKPWAANQ